METLRFEMEYLRSCPLCGSTNLKRIRHARRVYGPRHNMPKFTVTRCRECSFAFTNPRPTQNSIGLFYQGYFGGFMQADVTDYSEQAGDLMRLTKLSSGRILDVGVELDSF